MSENATTSKPPEPLTKDEAQLLLMVYLGTLAQNARDGNAACARILAKLQAIGFPPSS